MEPETSFPRALPTETKVDSGTSQSKSGTFVNLSRKHLRTAHLLLPRVRTGLESFFTLVTGPSRSLSLKLGDSRVDEPQIRARLGTCEPHTSYSRVFPSRYLRAAHLLLPRVPVSVPASRTPPTPAFSHGCGILLRGGFQRESS